MRGRRQGLAAVVVAVATLAAGYGEAVQATQAGASAPQAERPTLEGGYSLTFTNPKVGEWDDIYRGKEGNLLVFEDVYHGKFFKWYATEDLNTVKSVGRKTEFEHDPHNGVLNFPLSVGKKWTHYYTNTVLLGLPHRAREPARGCSSAGLRDLLVLPRGEVLREVLLPGVRMGVRAREVREVSSTLKGAAADA